MTHEPLDPRMDRLIGLLYGELSEAEEREVSEELERDASLRADWEELVQSRRYLRHMDALEMPPRRVVFVEANPPASAERRTLKSSSWRERFARLLPAPAWAFSAAVLVLAGLAIAGLRVQRIDSGIALRFGPPESSRPEGPAPDPNFASTPRENGGAQTGPSPLRPEQDLTANEIDGPVSGGRPASHDAPAPTGAIRQAPPDAQPVAYLPREEFERYQAGIARSLGIMLEEYGRNHDRAVGDAVQTFFTGLRNEEQRDYQELRARIEDLQYGFMAAQNQTQTHVDYLERQQRALQVTPVSSSPR